MRRLLFALATAGAFGADFPEPFNTEPGTTKPMPAEQAAASMKVPPGFHVSLFAGEPDVQQPIAMATDSRGRLWVAECYTYAESTVGFEPKQRDRIVIFEDTDNDGRFDKRTVFWDEGQRLTSIEIGFGGVWATCAPQLLFIPDRNGDDIPDGPPEVVLDGWNSTNVRHNIVNGLRWGPDGWLYGRHGILATSRVGAPGTPDDQRTPINCGIWRYHPTRKIFEVVASGTTNPWGMDWNEAGEAFFTNTVIGHLWHLIPGAHYQRMYGEDLNPYAYQLMPMCADHWHFDTGAGWTKSRAALDATATVAPTSDALGGGHAHCGCLIYQGDQWPAEYRGKLLTINFHGRRINVDRLERSGSGYVAKHEPDFLQSADPWFRGIDLIEAPDGGVFLADWSDSGECHNNQGVNRTSGRIFKITYGEPKPGPNDVAKLTDTELVQAQLSPNEWLVRTARRILHERATEISHRTAANPNPGYKFFTEDPARKAAVARAETARKAGDSEAARLAYQEVGAIDREFDKAHPEVLELSRANGRQFKEFENWYQSVTQQLEKAYDSTESVTAKLRCMWARTLVDCNKENRFLEARLGDADEDVYAAAIRLLSSRATRKPDAEKNDPGAQHAATALARHQFSGPQAKSLRIAVEFASAAQFLAPASSEVLMRNLSWQTPHATDDKTLDLMVWYATSKAVTGSDQASRWKLRDMVPWIFDHAFPLTRRYVTRLLVEDYLQHDQEKQPYLDDLLEMAGNGRRSGGDVSYEPVDPQQLREEMLDGMAESLRGLRKVRKPKHWDKFAKDLPPSLRERSRDIDIIFGDGRALDEIRAIARDERADLNARRQALQSLIDARAPELRATCEKLLVTSGLGAVAARGLAVSDDPKIGALLVNKYSGFQPGERSDVIGVLASRPAWAGALLDAIASGVVARNDLSAFHARQIRSFNDEALTKRLAEVWGEIRSTDEGKRALIEKVKTQLTPEVLKQADPRAGRVLFAQTCAVCHKLYGEGTDFGPDLTGSGRHDLSYLLENIADPSAIVPADFRLNIVTLKDGRILSGALGAKTERTIAVRSAGGTETIERAEIAKLEELPQSPMPEGLLLALNETQVRDLIAYLMTDSQVPLPAGK